MQATQLFVGTQQTATQVYVEPTSGDSSGGKKDDSAANASATAEETPSEDDSAPNANDAEPASDVPASGDEPAASAKIEKTGDGEAAESGEGASDEDLQAGPRKRRRVRAVREDSSEDGDSETGGEQAKQAEQVPEEPEEEWKAMVRCMAPKDLFAILGPAVAKRLKTQSVNRAWDPAEAPLSDETVAALKQRRVEVLLASGFCKFTR
mmetsp:Transcript_69371/g.159151  ORF Transcript_69371/g.159151 Transcript_69371/m.159151 type:complete len:208 (-) Transcript_69371:105-728(-)